jgi:two-component system, chemotaxis family, protein-glutamate methylesterase/glutaminase
MPCVVRAVRTLLKRPASGGVAHSPSKQKRPHQAQRVTIKSSFRAARRARTSVLERWTATCDRRRATLARADSNPAMSRPTGSPTVTGTAKHENEFVANPHRPFSVPSGGKSVRVEDRASRLVVVGASAGGVEALKTFVAGLPPELPAAVGVVLHVSPNGRSRLPEILSRAGRLPTAHALDGEPIRAGRIYVAVPDRHLVARRGRWVVVRGPRENHARPAIDPLFRSAALEYGRSAIAVVLTGSRGDGVVGAAAVSARGGVVIVQDPEEAEFGGMPSSTISGDHPDRIMPLATIAPAVVEALDQLPEEKRMRENADEEMSLETRYSTLDRETIERARPPGEPSAFSCPACGGVLWEVDDGGPLRYRCRVGHAYTPEAVYEDQTDAVEYALWAAFRALHERAELTHRIAHRTRSSGATSKRFEDLSREALDQANLIRTVLLERNDDED